MEQEKMTKFNKIFPWYAGLSADLLFWVAIDSLFLTFLKENGKKINYMTYIKEMKNEECNNAIKRLFLSINVMEINKFIDNVDCMSKTRKSFYKNIIEKRYEILKEVYENIK